jgi:hypothetical protein
MEMDVDVDADVDGDGIEEKRRLVFDRENKILVLQLTAYLGLKVLVQAGTVQLVYLARQVSTKSAMLC